MIAILTGIEDSFIDGGPKIQFGVIFRDTTKNMDLKVSVVIGAEGISDDVSLNSAMATGTRDKATALGYTIDTNGLIGTKYSGA